MSHIVPIFADIGIKALWYLYIWLISAIASQELSRRKGYGEKWGLGTGLLTSFVGVIIWMLVPAKPEVARGPGLMRLLPGTSRKARRMG
jgi:hypothetical protein